MFEFTKLIGRIAGWLDALGLIMVILKMFYKDLFEFIEKAVVAGNEAIMAWKSQGMDEAIISSKKAALAAQISADAKEKFSGSPSRVAGALIEFIRGAIVTKIRMDNEDKKELYRFDMMQREHPVTTEQVKKETEKTYPQLWGN